MQLLQELPDMGLLSLQVLTFCIREPPKRVLLQTVKTSIKCTGPLADSHEIKGFIIKAILGKIKVITLKF